MFSAFEIFNLKRHKNAVFFFLKEDIQNVTSKMITKTIKKKKKKKKLSGFYRSW